MPKYLDLKPGERIVVEVVSVTSYKAQDMSSALEIRGYEMSVAVKKCGDKYTKEDLYRDFPVGSLVVLEATRRYDREFEHRLLDTGDDEALENNLHRYYKLVTK